ncbi:unnamed protein product, partial [Brenthis ino]
MIFGVANNAVRVPFDINPSGRGVGGIVTWLWLQEAGNIWRRTDLVVRVSSRADKYSAVAGDAVDPSGGASITTVYRSAAGPAASRSVHTYRYVETSHVFDIVRNNE